MLTSYNFIQIGLIALSLGFTGFFAGAETALFAVDPLKIKALVEDGSSSARIIDKMLEQKERLLGILLTGTNLAMVFGTVMMTSLTKELNLFGSAGPIISASIMVVLVLIFAEVLPKTYAARNPKKISLSIAKVLRVIYIILLPLSIPFEVIPRLLLRVMGKPNSDTLITEDAILTMITIGKEEGEVDEYEEEMIEAVLESDTTIVRDIMVPRVDIVCVNKEDTPLQVVDIALEVGFSRIPVYDGTVDNIIGIVCVKDLLAIFDKKNSDVLCDFLRPVHYVPETKSARDLLNELKEKHFYMTIVLDEFGGTAGLVTMEDLIEEIVGEIRDEYDYDEEEQMVMKPNGDYIIDGRMTIDDINDLLDLELPEGEFTTIGGLLYTLIGRVPDKGETALLEEEGYKLVAESVARRKIQKVRLIKLKDSMQLKNTS